MNCPTCPDERLLITDRQGVEVDYCPGCRGIWLDRGELDKILDRADTTGSSQVDDRLVSSRPADRHDDRWRDDDRRRDDDHFDDRNDGRGGRRRRRGMLADLLDFG